MCTPILDRSDRKFARSLRRLTREYLSGYGSVTDLRPYLREAAIHLEKELDYHVQENGLSEPRNARRLIARWQTFNQ